MLIHFIRFLLWLQFRQGEIITVLQIRVFQFAGNWAQSKASETLLKACCKSACYKSARGVSELWKEG